MFIKVNDLKKSYGNGRMSAEILKGVSFEVKVGEILTVLGPSGSGKSTLLNLIGGLDTADSGSIQIDGTDIVGLSEKKLSAFRRNTFGFIYQFYNLVSDLNVYENVEVCHWLGDKSLEIEDIHKKSNTTIIIVTHNTAIADMSDHVIEIKDGIVALDKYNDNILSAAEVEW